MTTIKTIILCLILSLPFTNQAISAGGYPQHKDKYINDFANVITPTDAKLIRDALKQVYIDADVEGTVVTINSISDYQTTDHSIEEFATNLFNYWGVGNATDDDGFMILVSVKDRKCRIELGDGYGTRYNVRMKEIIDKSMIPFFKQGDYSRGIYQGSMGVVNTVTVKISWFWYYKWYILSFVLGIVLLIASSSLAKNGKTSKWYPLILKIIAILLLLLPFLKAANRAMRVSSSDDNTFGGGSSSGSGGASGDW
jgi:uncharacterized membrane protein YgcG